MTVAHVPGEGRTRRPEPLRPSLWVFPDPSAADEHGVVGTGADLAPETLVAAYRSGIFPWPHGWDQLPWFSPDPRAVVWPERLHVSRSLRRRIRREEWITTCDRGFDEVVLACSRHRGPGGTWITPEMRTAYGQLHRLGWAHSIEIWESNRLVGGLYGVQVGAVFTGESMFHRATDASKVALWDLVTRFVEAGGVAIDVQLPTAHLVSLGAVEMPRSRWLETLSAHRDREVRMRTGPLPARRLTE